MEKIIEIYFNNDDDTFRVINHLTGDMLTTTDIEEVKLFVEDELNYSTRKELI